MEELKGKAHRRYIDDLNKVISPTIDKVIALADKHNVDRDSAIKHFAEVFSAMAEIATFQNWGENNG